MQVSTDIMLVVTLKGLHAIVNSATFFTKHLIDFHPLTVMHDVHLPPL